MSFKLVGDDAALHHVVKKRRVTELLVNSISEEEAVLTKNGRYSCMICSHRPVFDTIEMLCVHRKGKKHNDNARKRIDEKKERMELIEKRQQLQEDFNVTATEVQSSPLLNNARKQTFHALLTATPYNPCVKARHASSIFQKKRKQTEAQDTSVNELNFAGESNSLNQDSRKDDIKEYVFPFKHSLLKLEQKSPKGVSNVFMDKEVSERYIRLKSAGWRLDANGKWFKSEDVEFDSDEEEPEPLYNSVVKDGKPSESTS